MQAERTSVHRYQPETNKSREEKMNAFDKTKKGFFFLQRK